MGHTLAVLVKSGGILCENRKYNDVSKNKYPKLLPVWWPLCVRYSYYHLLTESGE